MGTALWNDEQERPLRHLRVVDLTIMLPGPFLTRILGQYGAEVVKVENLPSGDPVRGLDKTALHQWLNQGKRSVAIALKSEAGAELVRRLVTEADVFVENFREGVMAGLGLGYEELSQLNPNLLYASIRGFSGRKNSERAGHDLNFVATSGCGEWFLERGANYSTHWGDLIGGVLVPAVQMLAHLSNPDRRGMHLLTHIDQAFRTVFLPRAVDAATAETLPSGERSSYGENLLFNGTAAHSRYYRCQDADWISMNTMQPKHWARFCAAVGKPAWSERLDDPAMIKEIESLFLEKRGSEWEGLLSVHDACVYRVIPWAEHLASSTARTLLQTDPLVWAGFAANPKLTAAPALGQDTYGVLQAMGVTNKELSEHLRQGVLFQPGQG